MRINLLSIIFCLALLEMSCTVGPDYVKPNVTVPTHFKEAKGKKIIKPASKHWKIAKPQDVCDRGAWWKIFHDRQLNILEDQLNIANQNIINAYYNYEQAKALVDEARASYFPTLTGSIALTRQKQGGGSTSFISSSTTGTTSTGAATTGGVGGIQKITVSHAIIANVAWEPDIWGLVRRTVEASQASADASAALYASTRLSLQASLAQYYFELHGVDRIQKLLNETVIGYKRALQITRHQYAAGTAARSDIVQAQSLLDAAQALAINNGIARAQYEHAIAILIGVPPAHLTLKYSPLTTVPPPIPLELPSELLERRPDIAQAERLMAAANAQIGVDVAAYFPTFSLSGVASAVGNNLSHWFSVPTLGWAYGPQFTELLYDGGLRAATVRAAKANYYATVASYRQTVLNAFQDVEDNLVSLRVLNEQSIVEKKAVAAARLALKLVMNQYKVGVVAYSSVITAQIAAFNAEQTAATVEYQRMTSAAGLIKALGGGWNVS